MKKLLYNICILVCCLLVVSCSCSSNNDKVKVKTQEELLEEVCTEIVDAQNKKAVLIAQEYNVDEVYFKKLVITREITDHYSGYFISTWRKGYRSKEIYIEVRNIKLTKDLITWTTDYDDKIINRELFSD